MQREDDSRWRAAGRRAWMPWSGLIVGWLGCGVDDRAPDLVESMSLSGSDCVASLEAPRCAGNSVQRCVDGEWETDAQPCSSGCAEGACRECDPETFGRRCEDGQTAVCDGGRILRQSCPEGRLCEAGACASACLEGNVQCDGEQARSACVGGSAYVPVEPCFGDGVACFEGRCVECRPGQERCDEAGFSSCSLAGAWLPALACPPEAPACSPALGRCSACEPGSRRCNAEGNVERCDAAGAEWLPGETCSGEAPVCVPETGACGECSVGDVRFCVGSLGNCAAGQQRCDESSHWGPCSIQPAAVDTCTPGDDADCNGTPNDPPGGCECTSDVSCGTSDVGRCQLGASRCAGGRLGACTGAIAPASRNCRSSLDNDCDGRPDNRLDAVCECVPDQEEACDAHGALDGVGNCRAGRRTCNASAGALSSEWGPCLGSVGPAPRNCGSGLDNDCNGVPDADEPECAPPEAVLTLESRGNAAFGVVRSSPPGLECTAPPCRAAFPEGTRVTLTAHSLARFEHGFSGWGGPCAGLDECSFAVASDVTVTAAFAPANVAFVTSAVTNGDLGGREGGDALCNELAAAAGLQGRFLAWLSTSTGSAVDRLRGSRGWIRTDGLPLLDALEDLPNMFHPLRVDERGRDVGTQSVLTASGGSGQLGPPFRPPCGDFTSALSGQGVVDGGLTSAVGLLFSTFTQAACTVERPIYCFGTGREVSIHPEPNSGRLAFISDPLLPGGGRARADQFCQAQATGLGLSGRFRAVLTTSTASAASPFDLSGPPWVGLDGVRIVSTARAFFEAEAWDTVPKAEVPNGNSGVRVGGSSLTQPGTPDDTCADWTSTAGNMDVGASGMTSPQQFFHRFGASPCSEAHSLVCLEE